jgi:hypothetical protein|tara:strand:+ start:3477 stop:3809 length:333 start_codon:yes stop_codon:yes gene_type:complete
MSYNWTITTDETNNTVSLHLKLKLQEYHVNKPPDPAIKVNMGEALKYLRKKGYKVGRMLQNATVTNRSEQHCRGTWIFELKNNKNTPTPRKKAISSRKAAKTKENTKKEV